MEMLRPSFCTLKNLHDCAKDLLHSPMTRQALAYHRNEKWVDEVCEGSLRILDVCGITRDVLLLVKEHLQRLQSALRRSSYKRSNLQRNVSYRCSRTKIEKEMRKCLEALKGMAENCAPLPISDADHNAVAVVIVLRELRTATISIVDSILSFMCASKPKRKLKRQSIFKFFLAKRVVNILEEHGMLDVDPDFSHICDHDLCEKSKLIRIQTAIKRLESLEAAIEDLEVELECMFKHLMQTRVSLLNILNQ